MRNAKNKERIAGTTVVMKSGRAKADQGGWY